MNIIVTGASTGIGYELVLQLCKQAQNRVIGIARTEAPLLQLQEQCSHNNMIPLIFDLENSNIEVLIAQITTVFSKVDVLINNAGILHNKPFTQLADADWQQAFSVNLFAVVRLLRALHPLFSRPLAHVVNIGSMGGFQGSAKFAGLSAYSASKAALACLTECLAEEWKHEGIKVNCLALGAVQTDMLAAAFPDYEAPVTSAQMAAFIAHFALNGQYLFNGKILPVSLSSP